MIYPESKTYDLQTAIDLQRELDLQKNLDNFQEFFNYIFGIQALPLTLSNKSFIFNVDKKDTMNIYVEKVDKL